MSLQDTVLTRVALLRRDGFAFLDAVIAAGTNDAPQALRDEGKRLTRECSLVARYASALITASPFLGDTDLRQLGKAFKGVVAALSLKRYIWWDTEVLADEDRVLGTRQAGDAEESVDAATARELFDGWTDEIGRRLELAVPVEAPSRSHDGDESPHDTNPIRLFISHAAEDREFACRIVNLLRAALNLPASTIRCTSVDGYRLPGGADTDEQRKTEVKDSTAFIGIVSRRSIESTYVLFELGARWGGGHHLLPLLAPGAGTELLRGPLVGINALRGDDRAQLLQLVSDVARVLGIQPDVAAAYNEQLEAILTQVKTSTPTGTRGTRDGGSGGSVEPNLGPNGWMAN